MKSCSKCKTQKEMEEFDKNSSKRDGHSNYCKPCMVEYRKPRAARHRAQANAWYAANKEYADEKKKAWSAANKDKHKGYSLKHSFGITLEQFNNMKSLQQNKCAICGIDGHLANKGTLYVDHNHVTGAVRELLCNKCNTALGMIKENPETALSMAVYIKKHLK